ncbi:Uncharacterized protein K02A2.6 [Stylophora pistillata]|uniref:Uncharacterized protein K02A2.6 n=1 Tax=Stylophora pistillata TaxID=50429 RepID=A0A2B4RLQ5_STYPI|nr:Uncharacterized protein K02A2.6 [Stylophora pistillata]
MHIDLDPSVTPVHAPTRRVPVAKLNRVNEELKRLCEEGIIRPVTQPTDWLSNMLVKEKPNGKLRICIDLSQTINKAIKRPQYTIPTIEERLPLLTNAKVFTVVDVSEAFHTIELDEDSSLLTTFRGPNGRYCNNRMPFGIASGPEEYQRRQHEFLDGLNGKSMSHEAAFNSAKTLVASTTVLRYYDVSLPVTLQVDASDSAIGGVLLQEGHPVCFTSHTLSATEKNYAHIEKECLAIVSCMKRKELFVANTLSRAPLNGGTQSPSRMTQDYDVFHVNLTQMDLSTYLVKPGTMNQIRKETEKDPSLMTLNNKVLGGWPHQKSEVPEEIRAYWDLRDEISVYDGVLFKYHQVIVPTSLRPELLQKIHKAHQLSEWPHEPMQSHAIPSRPWERVSPDLFQLNGSNYLVLVDHYSDYIELGPLKNTSAVAVIRALKRNFARHSIPDECVTDNGPQFVSHEYARFAREYGFTSIRLSPYHSRGNGKAESEVKIAKNILKKFHFEDPYLALLAYRNTPQQGYQYSPAQRLKSRKLHDIIPTAASQLLPQAASGQVIVRNIEERRARSKAHYNKRASGPLKPFAPGEEELYYTLLTGADIKPFAESMELLDNYFAPQLNVPFKRHQFRQMEQASGESMDQFVCRLRQKVISCEFQNVDEAIRDQLIEKCRDPSLHPKFLEKGNATLKDLQDLACVQEAVNMQVKAMDQSSSQVNTVSGRPHSKGKGKRAAQGRGRGNKPSKQSSGSQETKEHDRNLHAVLTRLKEKGLTLNGDKCHFRLPKLTFFSHDLSRQGVAPSEEKVAAILKASPPQDASQDGEWQAISYTSRNLTKVERRYSQTEKEAVAVVWARERFNIYVYWQKFELETDHKPLECIFGRLSKPSARIKRWVLRLQGRFYEVVIMRSTAAKRVVDVLTQIFYRYGFPFTLKSDNSPKFWCEEFEKFLSDHGIKHLTSPPFWPQANGHVERQNRTLLKSLKNAHIEGKNWHEELQKFLLAYRTTPQTRARDRDWNHKLVHKEHADNKRGAAESPVTPGDLDLVKNMKTSGKLEANVESEPYTVQTKGGSEVTVRSKEGVEHRRNSALVKRYNPPGELPEATEAISQDASLPP